MSDWSDERVHQLYTTAKEAYYAEERKEAIRALGRLARNSNSDAARALGILSRDLYYEDERKLATQELGKD